MRFVVEINRDYHCLCGSNYRVKGTWMFQNTVPYSCSSDSDEEPVTKQPRLSRGRSRGSGTESPGQSARSTRTERAKRVAGRSRSEYCNHPVSARSDPSDSDASSENRSISEGSYFEVCKFADYDSLTRSFALCFDTYNLKRRHDRITSVP